LFVCYTTRADTTMSLRQERQKSWKTLGKGELPEKPTSSEFAPEATRTAQARATSWPAGRPAQAQLPLRLRALSLQVYKFKFDLQPGSLTDQVAGEHQPSYKHP